MGGGREEIGGGIKGACGLKTLDLGISRESIHDICCINIHELGRRVRKCG